MSKKLSLRQIDDLFVFCREHYVYHHDLQLELVDHLASAIEQKWEENPRLTYTEALWEVFGKFGIYGFSTIRKAKEKALRKKYNRLMWKCIGQFYKLPKIIMTIAMSLVIFTSFRFINNVKTITLLLVAGLAIFSLTYLIYYYPKKFKLDLVPGKSFILYEQLKMVKGTFWAVVGLPLNIYNVFSDFSQPSNYYTELGISVFLSFFIIMMYASFFYVPQKIKDDFVSEYPQFIKIDKAISS